MLLNKKEERLAKSLFQEWFLEKNGGKNPSDVNTFEKYMFSIKKGWENLELMQRARKANTDKNGYPYPWTKREHWIEST